jgi:predicted lipoprotein
MSKAEEIEEYDELMEQIITQKAIGDLSAVIKSLSKAISSDSTADAIKGNVKVIERLVEAIQGIQAPAESNVKVEVNQQEIVTSLQGICSQIVQSNEKVIEALNSKKQVDRFDVQRDNFGNTKTVKVIYK